jgi:hypothetical protein
VLYCARFGQNHHGSPRSLGQRSLNLTLLINPKSYRDLGLMFVCGFCSQ